MFHFATTNPELAKHVHRLQFRIPSMITYSNLTGSCLFGNPEDSIRLSKALEVYRALEDHDPSIRRMDEAGENVVGSPQQRRADQTARISVGAAVWDHSWRIREALALLPNETLALLPNLFHTENAVSTLYRKHLAETEARLADYDWIDFLDLYEEPEEAQTLALAKGVRGMISHMPETIASLITSLKLREALLFDTFAISFPKHLQHLDLEIRIRLAGEDRFLPFDYAYQWRWMLETLSELKSLRLAFACGGGHYADEEHSDGHSWMDSDTFYIDDLLIDPSDSAGPFFFSRLRSLRLVNCSLRVQGLQTIAMRHSATLKELELSRVTFDPLYCVGSWSEIGAMCHEALPNLTHLRLAKLITHSPITRFEGKPETMTMPNRWNRGLEGATSYEWIRNGRGSGADLEIIGPKCPWHK